MPPTGNGVAIRCRGLKKRFVSRASTVDAVDGLELEVRAGECFGLLGPNGAGKTTTIEILEGLLPPTSGEVEILGQRWDAHPDDLRQRIGISLQETRFAEKLSVRETLVLFRSFYRRGLPPEEALALVSLQEKSGSWVGKLSGGQRQRLAVACALVGDPELLFLDEPTTGLDPQSRRALWEVLRELRARGRTILLTTHYMDEAERLCDRVAVVDHGRVIALGSPAELVARLGGEHIIEFALEAGGNGLREEDYRRLPGVSGARIDLEGVALTVTEPHVTIPALLDRLGRDRLALARLATRHVSLEDVFVDLTGRHLRDETASPAA